MPIDRLGYVHQILAGVCPIVGASISAENVVTISPAPEATAQQVANAGVAVAAINWSTGDAATWVAEHGGDSVATARRIAADMVDDPNNPICLVVRAALKVVMDEIQKIKQGSPKPSKTWDEHKAALKAALKAGLGDS